MLPPLAAFQLAFADIFAAHFDISSCHYAISFISSLLMPFSLPADVSASARFRRH
jgi:hypothetical protein